MLPVSLGHLTVLTEVSLRVLCTILGILHLLASDILAERELRLDLLVDILVVLEDNVIIELRIVLVLRDPLSLHLAVVLVNSFRACSQKVSVGERKQELLVVS